MGTFYHAGPVHRTEDALPVDNYRVKAFYQERDGAPYSEAAICDRGKWWAFYHKDEAPMAWHHMRDHRMTVGAERAEVFEGVD